MVPLFLGSCHIDKDYDLKSKNIDYEINAGQQIVVPIGSFPTIKIKDLLSKPAEEYFDFSDEEYFKIFKRRERLILCIDEVIEKGNSILEYFE